jgi:retron-type reverse transcriptase
MADLFDKIISIENLFVAWKEFRSGKRHKSDVRIFERNLEENLFSLRESLITGTYQHGIYSSFYINDPKARSIQKAEVVDRVLHHAIYRILYPLFDKSFISDSYSCRLDKGTHNAVNRLEYFARKVSQNYTCPCFALKCDVKKFFASVNHRLLKNIIRKKIEDEDVIWLLNEIISSFPLDSPAGPNRERERERERERSCLRQESLFSRKGIPIGNLTSQLFANIYLNELDVFIKHNLRAKYYVRYCDDFVILSRDRDYLNDLIAKITDFLESKLQLSLHENKIEIRKLHQGIDFLGYVVLPGCKIMRSKTKRRMLRKVDKTNESSYLGLLKHCKGYKLEKKVKVLARLSASHKYRRPD